MFKSLKMLVCDFQINQPSRSLNKQTSTEQKITISSHDYIAASTVLL